MIQIVRQNYESYTKRDVKKAILVHNAKQKLGNPSQKEFMKMVGSESGVKSVNVKPYAITNTIFTYGPNLSVELFQPQMGQFT